MSNTITRGFLALFIPVHGVFVVCLICGNPLCGLTETIFGHSRLRYTSQTKTFRIVSIKLKQLKGFVCSESAHKHVVMLSEQKVTNQQKAQGTTKQ